MLNADPGRPVRRALGSGGRGSAPLVRLSALTAVLSIVAVVLGGCSSALSAGPVRPGPHVSQPEGRHELTPEDVTAWLDGKIPDALNRGNLPGAVVTVVHNGRILVTRGVRVCGYGSRRRAAAPGGFRYPLPHRIGVQARHQYRGDAAGGAGRAGPGR